MTSSELGHLFLNDRGTLEGMNIHCTSLFPGFFIPPSLLSFLFRKINSMNVETTSPE